MSSKTGHGVIDVDLSGISAAMYLRKSRAEDGMDTAEILRRHRETLTEYAAREGIRVVEVFQEVKSGESLYNRPEMLRLLETVKSGCFGAVLCMDIDRLSRNDMVEYGKILEAFIDGNALIVTPSKTYNLSEESDKMMAELRGLFSRYELNQIKERTKRGMIRAAKEGCHLSYAPYGYVKSVVGKKHTLAVNETEARFVRLAFDLYASGKGCSLIAGRLTELGARPRRTNVFTQTTVLKMIKNPVYIGKTIYNREHWTRKDGKLNVTIRPESEWICADGLHPPIIDMETWEKCQSVLKSRWRPAYFDGAVKSPLAGLVRCKRCGGRMQRRAIDGRHYLWCRTRGCCTSARFSDVEQAVISGLEEILIGLETEPDSDIEPAMAAAEARLAALESAMEAENQKKERLYDFLESGIYTKPVFLERMEKVSRTLDALESGKRDVLAEMDALKRKNAAQQAGGIRKLLDEYESADAPGRNALLQGIVDVIWYERPKGSPDFSLDIFLL